MNELLDKQLVEKYPKIFRDRFSNINVTAMCWGFEHGVAYTHSGLRRVMAIWMKDKR